MNEKEIGEISFEAEESVQAADSVTSEETVSDEGRKQEEQIAGPVKRGRGQGPSAEEPESGTGGSSESSNRG